MSVAGVQRSPLLCVDWGVEGVRERTTAIELTEHTAFVVTDALPPVGAEVDLDLRFGRRAPICVRGRVTQVRLSLEPGVPVGFSAAFVGDGPSLSRIAALLREPVRAAGMRASRVLRVLHVEKNGLLRDMFAYAVKRYFSSRELRVELTQTSRMAGARALIEDGALDALLVDSDTEDGSANEIVELARARGGERCWIVGIGAVGAPGRERMLRSGADIYLRKPLVLRDLLYSMELLFQEDPDDGLGLGAA